MALLRPPGTGQLTHRAPRDSRGTLATSTERGLSTLAQGCLSAQPALHLGPVPAWHDSCHGGWAQGIPATVQQDRWCGQSLSWHLRQGQEAKSPMSPTQPAAGTALASWPPPVAKTHPAATSSCLALPLQGVGPALPNQSDPDLATHPIPPHPISSKGGAGLGQHQRPSACWR